MQDHILNNVLFKAFYLLWTQLSVLSYITQHLMSNSIHIPLWETETPVNYKEPLTRSMRKIFQAQKLTQKCWLPKLYQGLTHFFQYHPQQLSTAMFSSTPNCVVNLYSKVVYWSCSASSLNPTCSWASFWVRCVQSCTSNIIKIWLLLLQRYNCNCSLVA